MNKRLLKYVYVAIIFFVGLSLGSAKVDNVGSEKVQTQIDEFEDDIVIEGNDYEGKYPEKTFKVKHNLFTLVAKDGETLLKQTVTFLIKAGEKTIEVVFGM